MRAILAMRGTIDNTTPQMRQISIVSPGFRADYRHTFGSQLAMKGESLYKIATLMGNSPEICRRHCAALVPESLADAVDFSSSATAAISEICWVVLPQLVSDARGWIVPVMNKADTLAHACEAPPSRPTSWTQWSRFLASSSTARRFPSASGSSRKTRPPTPNALDSPRDNL
jgi:hypothetical protein